MEGARGAMTAGILPGPARAGPDEPDDTGEPRRRDDASAAPQPQTADGLRHDWHAVAFAREVGEDAPLATMLMGEPIVLWRSGGRLQAWLDQCPHRGAPLSCGRLKGDRLVCAYHGWEFDGTGACVHIPALPGRPPPAGAKAHPLLAAEGSGLVWVSLGRPPHDVPRFPECADPLFRVHQMGPYEFANAFRAIENFLDVAHFPFVHGGIIGVEANPEPVPDLSVTQDADGLVTSEVSVFQPFGDPRGIPVQADYRYRVLRPTTACFVKRLRIADPAQAHRGKADDRLSTYITVQPLDETRSLVRLSQAMNFAEEVSAEDIRRRTDLIVEQDRQIVIRQRPARLPLAPGDELHVRADRVSVAYRRWLRALNVTYGTICTDR